MEGDNKRQLVEIQHASGAKFDVYLTKYEIKRCQEDGAFKDELVEKYYMLQQQNLIFGHHNTFSPPPSSPNTEPNTLSETQPVASSVASSSQSTGFCEGFSQSQVCVSQSATQTIDEELLITAVSQRPALYNFKLALVERTREIVRKLWLEVIEELNLNVDVDTISKKWKSIRGSYLRARANVNQKMASGTSSTAKLEAEKIRQRHKNYDLLTFLDDSCTNNATVSNLLSEEPQSPLTPPTSTSTPSGRSSTRSGAETVNTVDKAFLDTLAAINRGSEAITATQHFCMRVASSLDKFPRRIKNKVEIEILQLISKAEDEVEMAESGEMPNSSF